MRWENLEKHVRENCFIPESWSEVFLHGEYGKHTSTYSAGKMEIEEEEGGVGGRKKNRRQSKEEK